MNSEEIDAMMDMAKKRILQPESLSSPHDAGDTISEIYVYNALKNLRDKDNSELKGMKENLESTLLELVPLRMDTVFLIMSIKAQLFIIEKLMVSE